MEEYNTYNIKSHINWADEHNTGCSHFRLNPNILGSVWMERMFGVSLKGKTIGQLKKELDGGKEFPRLKTRFSKEPFKIDIVNYSGLSIDADVKKGVTTTELTAEDKITQDFISFFAGGVVENTTDSQAFLQTLNDID